MAVKDSVVDAVKVSRKTFVNPRAWLGYDDVKESSGFLWKSVKTVFLSAPPKAGIQETYNEALARLDLTEQTVQAASKNYFLFSMLFLGLGLAMVALCVYFLLSLLIADAIIALSLATFLLGQAFIFNFWHFQIKNRKLGCTFDDWRHGKPHGGTKE